MSGLSKQREMVRDAALRVIDERRRFSLLTLRLRDGYERYRPGILLGGGFVAGFLLGRKQFAQAVRSVFSGANFGFALMRSSLGSMLIAATVRKVPMANRATVPSPARAHG
ncbi:MAG: hypothetical protein ABI127_00295 [Dokdonella sp.]